MSFPDLKTHKITPFLWYDHGKALDAAQFYTSVFPNSTITSETPLVVSFRLLGDHVFHALNGGPQHPFTPAVSLMITCEDQAEIDFYWDKLGTAGGGKDNVCGWLADKYGLNWQVVPRVLPELMGDETLDEKGMKKGEKAFKAMMDMTKLDIEGLRKARDGEVEVDV